MDINLIKRSKFVSHGNGILRRTIINDLKRNKYIYFMLLPVLLYYILFCYAPMYGNLMAFTDYNPAKGVFGSKWVGIAHFIEFFKGYYFGRVVLNSVLLGIYNLIFVFPAPILLALLINEVGNRHIKKLTQTISYLPHFVSITVVVGMMFDFFARDGLVNNILGIIGIPSNLYMIKPEWFRTLFISSDIWQNIGWDSIIFFAAIVGVDQEIYEAAIVDGAGRLKQALHVTLPCILPTIIIMLIIRAGGVMSVYFEKVLLMYSPLTYETADVINTYVYRKGILGFDYGYAAAVGLFNSVINFILLISANSISRKVSETKLW